MNAVLFMGIQASGKSTFFQQRFAATHVRINLDMLRTRHREERLIATCVELEQPFVIDNTNVTRAERQRYLPRLAGAGISVEGYYFRSEVQACAARNQARQESQRVPLAGVLGTHAKLEAPQRDEGFAQLYYVRMDGHGGFVVEEWRDEV